MSETASQPGVSSWPMRLVIVGAVCVAALASALAAFANPAFQIEPGDVGSRIFLAVIACFPFVVALVFSELGPSRGVNATSTVLAVAVAAVIAVVIHAQPPSPNGSDGLEALGVAFLQTVVVSAAVIMNLIGMHLARRREI